MHRFVGAAHKFVAINSAVCSFGVGKNRHGMCRSKLGNAWTRLARLMLVRCQICSHARGVAVWFSFVVRLVGLRTYVYRNGCAC